MKRRRKNKWRTISGQNRRPRLEALEQRQLMAADMLGVVRGGHHWLLDNDGDTSHDFEYGFGLSGERLHMAGDWDGDGFDTPGVVRNHDASGGMEWLLDTDGDPDPEHRFFFGLTNHLPMFGDFNGDGKTDAAAIGLSSDIDPQVGLRTMIWYIAYGPFPVDTTAHVPIDDTIVFGFEGDRPVVGDWDGDGNDDVGIVSQIPVDGLQRWYLHENSGINTVDYGHFGMTPVVGDWDGDGTDNLGVVVSDADFDGQTDDLLTWWLATDRDPWSDITRHFGFPTDDPVVGNWALPELSVAHAQDDLADGATVDFGTVAANQLVERTFTVSNTGAVPLQHTLKIEGGGFQISRNLPAETAAGRTSEFRVVFQATSAASYRGSITLYSNNPGDSEHVINFTADVPDANRPVPMFSGTDVTQAGAATHALDVVYTDDSAIAWNSIGTGNVSVTGPHGELTVQSVVVDQRSNGTPRRATYTVAARGGSWDELDNGEYTVRLLPNQVHDIHGNYAAAATLGQFRVRIPETPKTLTLTIDDASVSENGGRTIGRVTRSSSDLSQPLTVRVTTSDTSEVAVPSSVTIAANVASASFSIDAVDDDQVDGDQRVTLTVAANDFRGDSAVLNVEDDDRVVDPMSGEIFGTVYHDRNGNGRQDGGEPGIAGRRVFLDLDQDGQLSGSDATATTDTAGRYVFHDVPAGSYDVFQELPHGWLQTSPRCGSSSSAELLPPPMTTSGSTATVELLVQSTVDDGGVIGDVQPQTRESLDLINLSDFRADPRFSDIDGRGFSAVIIDTGIDADHSFFGPDRDGDGTADRIVFSYDFADNDTNANDPNGHGTHVSATIGSENAQLPGVAPAANIIHLKVFSDSSGHATFGDIEQALQWVVHHAEQYNIASVNMSLGSGNFGGAITADHIGDELAHLSAKNVIVVSAAGNSFFEYGSTPGVAYPAADPNSLAVGAVWDADLGGPKNWGGPIDHTTASDRIVSWSQRHVNLTDVFAPGAEITSADRNGGIVAKSGTSMAAPHVAGAAVLAQQLAVEHLGRRLTLDEFRVLLSLTGASINDGDDEDDNVVNTGDNFKRLDMFSMGEAIYGLKACSHTVFVVAGQASQADFGARPLAATTATLAAAGPMADEAATVTAEELDRLAAVAIGRWQQAGASAMDTALLRSVRFRVVDLPGDIVSENAGNEIIVDVDAAGRGWFVDASPLGDNESGDEILGVDLLTVLVRQLGHFVVDVSSGANEDGAAIVAGSRWSPEAQQLSPIHLDINGDGFVTPLDVVLMVNALNQTVVDGVGAMDVSGDRLLAPIDVLQVINFINERGMTAATGEGEGAIAAFSLASNTPIASSENFTVEATHSHTAAVNSGDTDFARCKSANARDTALQSLTLPHEDPVGDLLDEIAADVLGAWQA